MYDHSTLMWQEWHCVKSASLKTNGQKAENNKMQTQWALSIQPYHRTRALMKAYISVYIQNITNATICCLLTFFFSMYSIKFPRHSTSLTRAINKYYNLWPIKNRQILLHTHNASIRSPFVYTYSDLYNWIL